MMATIYNVAQQAGVSTATVSRALNGRGPVAALTRRRIESAIKELGYEPNYVARSLVTATTDTIAIVLPDITNPFFPDLVKGIQLLADERRYILLLLNTNADPEVMCRSWCSTVSLTAWTRHWWRSTT
jgi:DNA-binding LacI/PurR family transcriptional regulator